MKDIITNIFCATLAGIVCILFEPAIAKLRKAIIWVWRCIWSRKRISLKEMEKLIRRCPEETGVKHFDNLVDRYKKGESAQDTADGPKEFSPITDDIRKAYSLISNNDKRKLYKIYKSNLEDTENYNKTLGK